MSHRAKSIAGPTHQIDDAVRASGKAVKRLLATGALPPSEYRNLRMALKTIELTRGALAAGVLRELEEASAAIRARISGETQ